MIREARSTWESISSAMSASRFFGDRHLLPADLAQDKAAAGFNDGQGLIQFMGDAGGHFSQGGHLAGLHQLLFRLDSFGNIVGGNDVNR